MYSLTRGRLPLIRGSVEPGGSMTPGRKRDQRNEVSAIERQRHDLLLLDHETDRPAAGLQQRRLGGDVNGFRDVADLERQIERDLVSDAQRRRRLAATPRIRSS